MTELSSKNPSDYLLVPKSTEKLMSSKNEKLMKSLSAHLNKLQSKEEERKAPTSMASSNY